MNIWDIFKSKSRQLFWQRLDDGHVLSGGRPAASQAIDKDAAYFVVRMREMYVLTSRVLWRKYYPVLHGFTSHMKIEESAIAGPGQLRELGDANLDRIVNLNYRLAGPTPFRGDDVKLLVGLYSVPGADAAKALIDTVGTLANLGGIALGQAPQVAAIVKTGVENILGLNDAKLQVGVSDSFFPPDPNGTGGNPLRTGAYVGIAAEARQVDAGRLWLVDGRLKAGDDPVQAANYDAFDYMVVSVERRDRRDDWPGLPGVADFQDKFGAIMADGALPVPDKKKRMGELWPAFTQALAQSMYLTQPDREAIAADVSKDLNARLKAMEANNPFETRSWGQKAAARKPPAEFDFVDVPEYTDVASPNSRKEARAAWAGKPFGP